MTQVSVVIPTMGRTSVPAAAHSVLTQTLDDVEVIVVDASGAGRSRAYLKGFDDIRIIQAPKPINAGEARWLGCQNSRGRWVAFLDDDDICAPRRLERQISEAQSEPDAPANLVTSNFVTFSYAEVTATLGMSSAELAGMFDVPKMRVLPRTPPDMTQDVVGYLFRRDRIRSFKRIVTSSILVDGVLARSTKWNGSLKRFEDWEWLTRISATGARWRHVYEPLVGVALSAPSSLSKAPVSLSLEHRLWPVGQLRARPRELGDLLCCDVGVAVAKQGDPAAATHIWRLARALGQPGWRAQFRLGGELARQAVRASVHHVSQTRKRDHQ